MNEPFPQPSMATAAAPRRRQRGFTLIETMVAVAITGVLSSVAWPSFESHLLRARRTDALVALMQAQLAEMRYRADHDRYGDLAEIGVRGTTMSGAYALRVTINTSDEFEIVASAGGRQARDGTCRHLRLQLSGSNLTYASGTDAAATNAADVNRRCWNQ